MIQQSTSYSTHKINKKKKDKDYSSEISSWKKSTEIFDQPRAFDYPD